jgi:2-(1,2-epoxy-1,2-dihydrophenyl)acetyl-CoA isomerase
MADLAPLLFERESGVARLVLNRPDAGNAIDIPLARALMLAAIECDEDDAIRCVVLTGRGKLFCAGGDIRGFEAAGDKLGSLLKELSGYLHLAISRLSRMGKPLVTAVNGPAAGAGLSLAVLGDIALATRSAHFSMAYTAIGVTPDGGSTWLLPRLIGLRRAQEMMLLNTRIGAERAEAIGLISRVVDDGALESETAELAERLARSATAALGRTRNLLLESFGASFEGQMEAESRAIAASGNDPHGREGIRAFLEKRQPAFKIIAGPIPPAS